MIVFIRVGLTSGWLCNACSQAAEERRLRHEMAQEAIQISRLKDIERRNKRV